MTLNLQTVTSEKNCTSEESARGRELNKTRWKSPAGLPRAGQTPQGTFS